MTELTQTESSNEEQIFVPQAEMLINDLEILRTLSDPLRMRIIELLVEPLTVKEIAPKLNIGKTKLYYHINLLEKHGVIRVVRTRLVSGILEKSYQITAMRFRPALELFAGSDDGDARGVAIFDSIFDITRADFVRSIKRAQRDATLEASKRKLMLGRTTMYLTEEQAHKFAERFDALLEEVKEYETATPDTSQYSLTFAFIPQANE